MKPSKSISSLANSQQQTQNNTSQRCWQPPEPSNIQSSNNVAGAPTSPICRCRVMYLGSSVPHITKDGLQGIQEPLRELYPDQASSASGNAGIDSWLSVWSNGILIENVDGTGREVKRFFKIDALHYCAAVKYVPQIANQSQLNNTMPNEGPTELPKFLPLDSPHARMQQNNSNPPIFASILRRTTGVKVLECHAFICKREAAANALVRCCFHAYADTMYAKQIGANVDGVSNDPNNNVGKIVGQRTLKQVDGLNDQHRTGNGTVPSIAARRSKSIAALNDTNSASEEYRMNGVSNSNYHEVNYSNTMMRGKNLNENYTINSDMSDNGINQQQSNNNLLRQHTLSKSMHHLNQDQNGSIYGRPVDFDSMNPSTSFHNLSKARWNQQSEPRIQQQQVSPSHQPFYNPYASRVPSYPPQNLIDQQANNSGTLRSIKSVAGNSIASTLLRSKKHAKAMSMAHINQDKITSFHQPLHSNGSTLCGAPFLMPPVPPMFLPNMPRPIINGSQTMRIPSRPMVPLAGPPMNFEAMTPKEMKKLLKKSAKYGIDPSRFGENGLPILPLRPVTMPPLSGCHFPPQTNKSGTLGSQSLFSMDMHGHGNSKQDMGSIQGLPIGPPRGPIPDSMEQPPPIKSILVKPNPEFLKSKAGKKWLKQQKEFKKLLPPHLDGLPIVFGPPPIDALEPAPVSNASIQPPTLIPPPHPGLPVMDSSGYYNPHPFYGPSGRASAASTLLRYSPHSQIIQGNGMNGANIEADYMQRSQTMYSNTMMSPQSMMQPQSRDFIGDDSSLVYGNNELGTFDRQFPFDGDRLQKRNHMVEQSVISLGDENDVEDDDDEQLNGYYNRVELHSGQPKSSESKSRRNEHITHTHKDEQQDYEQVISPNDDQSSYSSGIYRRGHINERAFSYSIRQEHKSNGGNNSDTEYASGNGNHITDNTRHHIGREHQLTYENPHPNNMFHNRHDQATEQYPYNRNDTRNMPVNELAARMESQLHMKSFANSRIKSHM